MKKSLILTILLSVFCLTIYTTHSQAQRTKPIKIVATVGQIADVAQIIGGEQVEVIGLMGAGVDPHLYKASESDVRKIANAQIIFYNGLYLEAKMESIFKQFKDKKLTVPLGEMLHEGYLLDSENYKGHFDPHIWFDVTLWSKVAQSIADTLSAYDAPNKIEYQTRAANYITKLEQLHLFVHTRANEIDKSQRILVTAHDAFRYFGRAYNFKVIGLQGISTESEAGTKDVIELAKFIAENKIPSIFIETSIPERTVKAVQEAVKAQGWTVSIGGELFSDAMGDAGTFEGTYIGMVTHNINTIVDALKEK